MSQYIKTYGRIRPSAKGKGATGLVSTDQSVTIETENGQKSYQLHRIFNSEATQEEVFNCVSKRIVEDSVEGFNGTIFAYGQTGSGKTHTMLGPCNSWSDPVRKGLIPRSIELMFQLLDKKTLECQKFNFEVIAEFVELYNEDIFDLLNAKNKVQLRDSGKDIQIIGAKSETVDNSLDLMHVVERGWQSRSTGSTAMNNESSRSHALLIIKIKTYETTGGLVKERFSTLNLVDLAGSERQSHTKTGGDQLKEAANINASLTVLGRCIRILSKPSGSTTYVPYRDSHLTHILKNSLGGNSKTAVIVNMHPDREFLPESSSTLLFAQSCTMIKNAVTRNEVMTGDQENSYKKAIQELRKEVDETRAKAREEFIKKLDEAEDMRHRLTVENDSLKAENSELRSKYNIALIKYTTDAESKEVVDEFKRLLSENIQNVLGVDLQDLTSKTHTLKLECDANEKRCHELQQELNNLRIKYQDNLNTTLQMQTPNAKERRSSTRPKRRETQYKPSPARMAELAEDDDTDLKLQEAAVRTEQLECEVRALQSKLEEAMERESNMQFEYEKSRENFQKKENDYSSQMEELYAENQVLTGKVLKGGEQLDQFLLNLKAVENKNSDLERQQGELLEQSEKELEELRKHYMFQIATLQKSQKDVNDEKEAMSSTLHDEIASLNQKSISLLRDFEAQSESLARLQKEIKDKEVMNVKLQEEIRTLDTTSMTLKRDFDAQSELLSSLQKEISEKNAMNERLQVETKTLNSKLVSLKQEFDAQSESLARLQKDVLEKSQTIDGLRKDLSFKSELVARLQQDISAKSTMSTKIEDDLNTKATLIASLEEKVVKKCEIIAKLQDEKSEAASDLATLKRRYEASVKDEAHEKKRYEDLQKKMQSEFQGYQRDIKTLREKKNREIRSIQQSLDVAQEELKNHEKTLKKQTSECHRKFDEDVAAMEKRFKETHIKEMKQQEEKIKRESMSQMETSLLAKDNKIRELEELKEYYSKIHDEDTETIANKLGNKQQRMSYVEKIRREKAEAEAIVAQLRSEIARLSKSNRDSNTRVLRSRNSQQQQ